MNKKDVFFGLIIAVLLAAFLSRFASSSPDGLERVAADNGFLELSGKTQAVVSSPLSGYLWSGVKNSALAKSVAGLIGTLVVFGLGYGLASGLKRRR
jgi:cobalt/nickel transport protein